MTQQPNLEIISCEASRQTVGQYASCFRVVRYGRMSLSDSEDEGLERQFKLVLLGDPQSGKTAIAQRSVNIKNVWGKCLAHINAGMRPTSSASSINRPLGLSSI